MHKHNLIGHLYYSGSGTEQDYAEAIKWFKEAADKGEPDSMFHLAICYNDGLGVEKDSNKMAYYMYAAADRGFQRAIEAIQKYNIRRP